MRRVDTATRRTVRAGLAVLVALAAAGVAATPAVLDDFREVLPQLQPDRRAELLERATQWQGLTAAQREAFAQRAAAWDALPRAERDARRLDYRAWQALTPDERARLQALAARLRALPGDERAALRARFDALDRSERHGWRLGPALGADYPALQPLLAQVPAAQHAPLLRVLRELTPVQRRDLGMLVYRTPPQQRDVLRRELLSTAAGQRDRWLRQRLGR